ncbi:ribonuclease T2 family protein [Shewanella sp. GXUN23E]|uniref:ribonuclease T2 family protein n=1 Tax=Shewanella sp. GXUN23E TaxID=3422498 RepID=UPI003D7EB27D
MKRLTLTLLLCGYLLPALSAPADGVLAATETCPLYQSKNKLTNPGNLQTTAGRQYQITEYLGRPQAPQWFRVRTTATETPLRWLSADCVDVQQFSAHKADNKKQTGNCNTRAQQDSFVLALSWQPAFCDLNGRDKTECRMLDANPEAIAHRQFSLHGLWPNKSSCGVKYGFCGEVKTKPRTFCDYPALSLSSDVRTQLEQVMPSARYGTCLQRHEYWKHGSCMTAQPDEYFAMSAKLINQINSSSFVTEFIARHRGEKVSREQWQQAFDSSFGQGAHRRVKLQCHKGLLTEVQMQLPLNLDAPLRELLTRAEPTHKGSCPSKFKLVD